MSKKFLIFLLCSVFFNPVWWATLYFNGATDANWSTLTNWWTDSAFTVPAEALPTNVDDVVISTSSWVYAVNVTVNTITMNSGPLNGYWLVATNGATFNGTSILQAGITANVTFNDSSFLDGEGVVDGNAIFNDSSFIVDEGNWFGLVLGNADVYYPAPNPIAEERVEGTVTYHGYDNTAPTITSISSDKANATYGIWTVIDIDITFSEAVTSTGNVTVTLETGATDRTCTFTVSNATTGTCNYTVQAGDASSDLTVLSVAGTIKDASLNAMTDFAPATNLAANKALVIDTTSPGIPVVTAPGRYDRIITTTSTATGTCETGATISIANAYLSTNPTTTVCSDSSFSVAFSWLNTSITPPQTVTFTQTDAAGNVSAGTTVVVDIAWQTGDGGGSPEPAPQQQEPQKTETPEETPVPQTDATPDIVPDTDITEILDPLSTEDETVDPIITAWQNDAPRGNTPAQELMLWLSSIASGRANDRADILILQQFLNGYENASLELTGLYDSETKAAVNRFQIKYASEILLPLGLTAPTGVVGPYTRAKINSLLSGNIQTIPSTPPFSINITPRRQNSPSDVKRLQEFLNDHEGESLILSGVYDWGTQEAINRFQIKYAADILTPWGINKPTGNVGIFTRAKIRSMMEQ